MPLNGSMTSSAAPRPSGGADAGEVDEQLRLERWLANMQPELERLHHEMVYAQAQIDVGAIKSAHDQDITLEGRKVRDESPSCLVTVSTSTS